MKYKDYNFIDDEFGFLSIQIQYLVDLLEKDKPKRICELGSGNFSQIFEQYVEKNKDKFNGELLTIDSAESFNKDIDIKNKIILPIDEYASIILNDKFYDLCNKFEGLEDWLLTQNKFDFVLIDAPFGFGFREEYDYSRIQILSFIALDKLSDNCVVIYHDSNRKNAKSTLDEFEKLLEKNNFKFEKTVMQKGIEKEMTIYKINKIK